MVTCIKCARRNDRAPQRYCRSCHAEYMRAWRSQHPLTPEQRVKDIARSKAGVYKRRGKLKPKPCAVCRSPRVEMHHADYARPLAVTWLCRECHLDLHLGRKAAVRAA